jgi:hypothetical protein
MSQCIAYLDDGRQCRRNARRLNGLCGTCHGITAEYKRCTQPVANGKYCGRSHKTQQEIAAHRGSRLRQNKRRSQHSGTTVSTSYRRRQRSYGAAQGSHRAPQTAQRTSTRSRKPPNRYIKAKRRSDLELSKTAKREAAKLCADAILGQNVLPAFQSQITDYVSEKLVDELTKCWDGRQCDEIAKLARGLLAVRGYFYRALQIIIDWLMLRMGYRDTARFFACQLVVAVPVVWYTKLVVAARILQITGICLCFANDRNLMECRCLHDLALFEGKEAIGCLMTAAIHDWREIAKQVPVQIL